MCSPPAHPERAAWLGIWGWGAFFFLSQNALSSSCKVMSSHSRVSSASWIMQLYMLFPTFHPKSTWPSWTSSPGPSRNRQLCSEEIPSHGGWHWHVLPCNFHLTFTSAGICCPRAHEDAHKASENPGKHYKKMRGQGFSHMVCPWRGWLWWRAIARPEQVWFQGPKDSSECLKEAMAVSRYSPAPPLMAATMPCLMFWAELCPPDLYVEVLSPSTSKLDCIWRLGLQKDK